VVTISGTVVFGETLTAVTSALSSEPETTNFGTISYQWKRNDADIPGATGSTYTLVYADIATSISVRVSTDRTQGDLISSATANVELPNLSVNGTLVSIAGKHLDYQATCDDRSVKLDIEQSVATSATLTLTAIANGIKYSDGQDIPLSVDEEVIEININIVSGDKNTSNDYVLTVANQLDANNILFKRWNDVVAVNRQRNNNISGVRWHINGETEVSQEWYIQITGEYYAEVNIADKWHRVCGNPEAISEKLIAYPNPVSTGENLTLKLPDNFTGGYIDIISLAGSTVKRKLPLPDTTNTLSVADWMPGIYLLNIVAPDGDRETIKIVVSD
jgi:hypothetical protein